ncbi:MAG: response regulator [Flavobacterium sp.]|uniref:response regulator n=1 Tax=Flavobacterium sp. TaxID=239 RepID=UPI00121847F2|nr:response regulator [Flavobacterium sp.]RZJ65743.1 MAG: response regulator [Flavobacterium sp.]
MNPRQNFTIFYTDDDPEDLEFFMEAAESLGSDVEVVTHRNGQNLIDALHNPPPTPHLLFLDVNMPGLTGFDVLQELRNGEKFKNIPVIIFTTSSDDSTIERSLDLGANFFVPKSGHFPTLKKSIEYALQIDWSTFRPTAENFVYAA